MTLSITYAALDTAVAKIENVPVGVTEHISEIQTQFGNADLEIVLTPEVVSAFTGTSFGVDGWNCLMMALSLEDTAKLFAASKSPDDLPHLNDYLGLDGVGFARTRGSIEAENANTKTKTYEFLAELGKVAEHGFFMERKYELVLLAVSTLSVPYKVDAAVLDMPYCSYLFDAFADINGNLELLNKVAPHNDRLSRDYRVETFDYLLQNLNLEQLEENHNKLTDETVGSSYFFYYLLKLNGLVELLPTLCARITEIAYRSLTASEYVISRQGVKILRSQYFNMFIWLSTYGGSVEVETERYQKLLGGVVFRSPRLAMSEKLKNNGRFGAFGTPCGHNDDKQHDVKVTMSFEMEPMEFDTGVYYLNLPKMAEGLKDGIVDARFRTLDLDNVTEVESNFVFVDVNYDSTGKGILRVKRLLAYVEANPDKVIVVLGVPNRAVTGSAINYNVFTGVIETTNVRERMFSRRTRMDRSATLIDTLLNI